MKKLLSLLMILSFLTVLGACSTSDEERKQEAKDEEKKEEKLAEAKKAADTYKPHLICPQVAILHELENVRDYDAQVGAPSAMMAQARMQNIAGDCTYKDDGIDINFKLHVIGARGPHFSADKAEFPYFIAVVDPNQGILNKNPMTVTLKFSGSEKISERDEDLHVFIPLPKEKNTTGPNYRVLAGFQLTKEQLDDVRKTEQIGAAREALTGCR